MAAGLEMNGELKLRAADCKNDKMAYICQVKHRDGSFDKPPTPSPKPQATTAAQTTAATPAQTTTATPVQTTTATPAQTATTTPAQTTIPTQQQAHSISPAPLSTSPSISLTRIVHSQFLTPHFSPTRMTAATPLTSFFDTAAGKSNSVPVADVNPLLTLLLYPTGRAVIAVIAALGALALSALIAGLLYIRLGIRYSSPHPGLFTCQFMTVTSDSHYFVGKQTLHKNLRMLTFLLKVDPDKTLLASETFFFFFLLSITTCFTTRVNLLRDKYSQVILNKYI